MTVNDNIEILSHCKTLYPQIWVSVSVAQWVELYSIDMQVPSLNKAVDFAFMSKQ